MNRRDALATVCDDGATESNRRRFLAGAAASLAATLGFSGTAAALDPTGEVELRQLRHQYQPMARDAFERHGGDLLALLAEAGYLDAPNADALDDLTTSAWKVGDTPTARLEGSLERDSDALAVQVEPETGRAYAIDDSGDDWTVFEVGDDGRLESRTVTPSGTICLSSGSCTSGCAEYQYSCEDDGCHVSFPSCTCSSCGYTCGC